MTLQQKAPQKCLQRPSNGIKAWRIVSFINFQGRMAPTTLQEWPLVHDNTRLLGTLTSKFVSNFRFSI